MSRNIIDYNVIRSDSIANVVHDVKEFIKAKWEPFGPMQMILSNDHGGQLFTQTVVKYAGSTPS